MFPNPSPLDTLAAFAIIFAAGALSVICISMYVERTRAAPQRAP